MNLRTLMFAAGLAALATGCTVAPDVYDDGMYGPGYPVYRDTDAYDGYYYVQIIYIDGEPWYVDDYRYAHPIPPRLRSHFRDSSWTRSLPPRFGRDTEVRDGYPLSRIVYINDVPQYVDDDRRARPLPSQVRSRFSYQRVVTPRDVRRNGTDRPPSPQQGYGSGARPMPPAYEREQERPQPPAYGRERMQQPDMGPRPAQGPTMMQERMREVPPLRPAQPAVRDGRGAPAGQAGEPVRRGAETRPTPQQRGRDTNDGRRGDQKQNGKADGRGKGRDDSGQDGVRRRDTQPQPGD